MKIESLPLFFFRIAYDSFLSAFLLFESRTIFPENVVFLTTEVNISLAIFLFLINDY
eukprot:GDKH01007603.1.p1 GENE.GDKH01007603.1~~GDKH01007603.1.p1  ORF type:complete len:57 (-),score=4.42 GDKH01007603.1:100-270(-)